MPIEIRTPEETDVPGLFAADSRGFGFSYDAGTIERRRSIMDLSRFRTAVDGSVPAGSNIVGIAGSFALDMTMPGGATVPMGGVTWVSVAATHRRQGLLRRLLDAIHADIDERGEPIAGLGASEGGIYGRFGYGVASQLRRISIDSRSARMRPEVAPKPGSVRFMEPDEARLHVADVWERARRARPGETARDQAWWDMTFIDQAEKSEDFSPVFRLRHDDGYAAYRVRMHWNEGAPGHELDLTELVAVTDEAHAALWNTLLNVDLVATITSRRGVALDDPLPYLLDNPRSVRTEGLDDCLWLRPHQPATLLGARTYGTEDRLVVEVVADATESTSIRWQVDGGATGGSAVRTRRRPDLVLDRAALGAICLGGVRPSVLARGRRLVETSSGALHRADPFFAADRLPHSQNPF